MQFRISDFGGRLPRRSKRLLPDNFAQEAFNTKLLSGELRGLRAPTVVHSFAPGTNPKRAWRIRRADNPSVEYWYSSTVAEAELVKCPLINDAYDRWYLFEPGQPPKVLTIDDIAAGTGPYDLDFTRPTTAPTATPTVSDPAAVRSVVYVYTYVTSWGEESSPSPPTTVEVDPDGSVTLSNFYTPTPTIAGRSFSAVRIYRSVSFSGTADLFYVADVTWGNTTYVDNSKDELISLNEQLPSITYDSPPSGIYGARVHPSGALVAFKDNMVYFSEPYKPHAWPETYQLSVADPIVGLGAFEQNVGVFTKGPPVLLYGPNPANIGILKFPASEPCVSYGSIVGAPEGVYYASHQGLVLFTAVGPKNVTQEAVSKDEWTSSYLSSTMSSVRYGTQYLSLSSTGVGSIIDTLEPRVAFTDIALGQATPAVAFTKDFYTGDVYVIAGDDVYLWDDPNADEIDYVWKSKQFTTATPVNFGAAMVYLEERDSVYDSGTSLPDPPFSDEYQLVDKAREVLLEVFMDNELVAAVPARDRFPVRLPSGRKGTLWEIRVTGQCRVYSVALAETAKGLADV